MMASDLRFLWLEVTGKCQLRCSHCYADSGPHGTHGSMTLADWRRVLEQGARLGVSDVQFIGGEPTLHPALPELVRHARRCGLGIEVFSNLARTMSDELWNVFELPGVRLATSYYAADPVMHDRITTLQGSYRRTRRNIAEAGQRGIPLRVGVVAVDESQDVDAAIADLTSLGVTDIKLDQLRQVGRGVRDQAPSVEQLCGKCADGSLAISPTGDVWPCVFARWMALGNVREAELSEINAAAGVTRIELRSRFAIRSQRYPDPCNPDCNPNCNPQCNPNCGPGKDGPFPGCPPTDPKK